MPAILLALGALIGLSLGALGGGGSVLTVPALVYGVGEPVGTAITASLVIVGVTALTGAIGHARAGRVRWGQGTAFGLAGVASSFLGTRVNQVVDPDVLLLAFAGLMVLAAVAMLRRTRRPARTRRATTDPALQPTLAQGVGPPRAIGPSQQPTEPVTAHRSWQATAAKVVAAGLVVGFLTGFFGVGGGFIIVPALTLTLGYAMPEAVGTSLLIIAINSAVALAARAGHEPFHWEVIVPFTAAAVAGSLAGKRLADRASEDTLTRAVAVLLVAVAAYVASRSLLALT